MKITSSEEYGIRILIRIASADALTGLSIPQLRDAEGLSEPHVAKICRTLRMEGFINSTPGHKGGVRAGETRGRNYYQPGAESIGREIIRQ